MELNPLQTHVAQLYREGLYTHIGTWEDAQLTHDALFLFLLQEAEGYSDLDALEGYVAVASDQLRDFLEAVASVTGGIEEDVSGGDQTQM
ncbi:hypothetical protein [Acidithiobacillus ferrianus]|uniref:hypothetical protein n=1 Tax=Acidithiobacillus ferrianus TaxID=2678518 RepID=UPI0034E4AB23